MTKFQFEKEIQNRIEADTDKKINIDDVKRVVEESENLIMELIATNEEIRFSWGVIGGKVTLPKKLVGAAEPYGADPYNFSFAKTGVPFCRFGRNAKFCTLIPASEWFSDARNQYGAEWDSYKREIDKDFGGEKYKKFAGLYGLLRDERKELRPKLQKEYEKMIKSPDYKKPTEPFSIDELKKYPIWAEGKERNL